MERFCLASLRVYMLKCVLMSCIIVCIQYSYIQCIEIQMCFDVLEDRPIGWKISLVFKRTTEMYSFNCWMS